MPPRFYLQHKNRNHFQHRAARSTVEAVQNELMILGMLPTRLQQDEGLSNEKQTFFHSRESALFHYGNYCNHMKGGAHKNTITQAHPLTEKSSTRVFDTQIKFANKSIRWVRCHYHSVRSNPQINLHIYLQFTPLGGHKSIQFSSSICHSISPTSSRLRTCFCMTHMDVWEVTQYCNQY